jgi:hypothetical protein
MGLPVQWGDVGTWLGTAAGIAALFRGLGNRQQVQFQGWIEMLEELTDLEPEELRRTVEDHSVIAEIFALAAEEAARTASDHKRYLLARVATAALRRDATPGQIDALLYLERTVVALNPADLTLLIVIGTTEDDQPRPVGEEQVSRQEMLARWNGHPDLLDPALAMLEQQGLIEGTTSWGGSASTCRLRPYSQHFLKHLLTDLGGWPPRRQLESGRG